MGEARLANLARSLKVLVLQNNGELTTSNKNLADFEQKVSKIYVTRHTQRVNNKEKQQHDEDPEEGHVISKENLALRETLTDLGIAFEEEKMLDNAIFKTDFYIPSANLVLEINGMNHYYPFSTRFNNFTNLKNKVLRGTGYSIFNLNSMTLEGMLKDPERKGLKELITKTVKTYTDRVDEAK